jgi:hypothetical protein
LIYIRRLQKLGTPLLEFLEIAAQVNQNHLELVARSFAFQQTELSVQVLVA